MAATAAAASAASSLFRFPGVGLVTGAGGTGIGAAVAQALARSGCDRLVLADIDRHSLARTRDAVLAANPRARVVARDGDVSDEGFAESLAADARAHFSRLDYLVSCAGVLGADLRSADTPVEAFDRVNRINYRGSWLVSRAAIRAMLQQEPRQPGAARGAIVNIASQLGIVARRGAAPYCASKSAIIMMTKADAVDYSQDDIRINCVCPGVIATPMTTGSDEVIQRLKPAIDIAPMQRMGTADEVANAALFLCSPLASFVQGHALMVDGGYTIN